eukprot:TRINITY_DN956_c0_g6_i1.p1 TRINITY_DN956_c0_g6~~TRINITY_DN956_c0_g6_i1.p1  ORF type:complete len:114 (+),score=12.28 TRINITY_DN956_c0_g6_i1:47-388(+)
MPAKKPSPKKRGGKVTGKSRQVTSRNAKNKNSKKKWQDSITKGSIRRIARRGGCKRIAANVYDEARALINKFVENVMDDTVAILEMTNRRTVRVGDILYALRKQDHTLYSVGN